MNNLFIRSFFITVFLIKQKFFTIEYCNFLHYDKKYFENNCSNSRGCSLAKKELVKLIHSTSSFNVNAGGGIRTHVPLRTNGFQDRLVMTTSIPLHLFNLSLDTNYITTTHGHCQLNFIFFYKLFHL